MWPAITKIVAMLLFVFVLVFLKEEWRMAADAGIELARAGCVPGLSP